MEFDSNSTATSAGDLTVFDATLRLPAGALAQAGLDGGHGFYYAGAGAVRGRAVTATRRGGPCTT
jgi:hypothetical protein